LHPLVHSPSGYSSIGCLFVFNVNLTTMKEYLYLFRGGDAREVSQSPEAMQAHMEKWMAWMKGLGENGTLVSGQPLQTEGKVVSDSGQVVTDGPFAEGKEIVGGYLIIKAGDLDGAVKLSSECPIFEFGGSVEVRETAEM